MLWRIFFSALLVGGFSFAPVAAEASPALETLYAYHVPQARELRVVRRKVRRFADDVTVGSRDLVAIARSHVGKTAKQLGLPRTLWCADFMNLVRRQGGVATVPSRMAQDQARGGRRIQHPKEGAIVTMRRGGSAIAGHTGIISAVLDSDTVLVVHGNSRHRVRESKYRVSQFLAMVDPLA